METSCCSCSLFESFSETRPFKVLELYSGIGGVNYALEKLRLPVPLDVVAMDINTNCNYVHGANFPDKKILERNLMSLSAPECDAMNIDLMTMSPPCQPFSRQGMQKDVQDKRCDSFIHIVTNVLKTMNKKPKFILLENVRGFEVSEARDIFVEVLAQSDYSFKEFLISPQKLGIPNSRLRYYLLAKSSTCSTPQFMFESGGSELIEDIPLLNIKCKTCRNRFYDHCEDFQNGKVKPSYPSRPLRKFLEKRPRNELSNFLLSDKLLEKYSFVLDIVTEDSASTCCFTRGYGHMVQGTGSVLQMNKEVDPGDYFKQLPRYEVGEPSDVGSNRVEQLRLLELRHFTPREVANLMCFPERFMIPEDVTARQMYKLLGNSVNVEVIALMLKLLFM